MKRLVLIFALALAPVAGMSQTGEEEEEGRTLMERGAELFFRGLMSEMEPALKEFSDLFEEAEPALRSFWREMGPAFAEIIRDIKDFSAYHPPEVMPNGDIIIRKKRPEEMEPEDGQGDTGDDIEI
ncbi:MAG: hypothetical protein ACU0DK_11000 [Pseudooceanicola sp.]